jgi:manganese/iron transport system permease protein
VAGLVFVLVVAVIGSSEEVDETSAIGVTLAGAFGLGVLLLSSRSGFTRDLTSFLVGSIITVTPSDLWVTLISGVAVVLGLVAFHKELVLGAFDRSAFAALGYSAFALDVVVLLLVEVTVVTAIPAVGTVLTVALLAAPAATARLWTDRVGTTMALSSTWGAFSGVVGLWVSDRWRVSAGAGIVLVAAALFLASFLASPQHGLMRLLRARSVALADPSGGGLTQSSGKPRLPWPK